MLGAGRGAIILAASVAGWLKAEWMWNHIALIYVGNAVVRYDEDREEKASLVRDVERRLDGHEWRGRLG